MAKQQLLIAGASHTGKTILSQAVADRLGWEAISTDSLSRHPGRPWPNPPDHVTAFYGNLEPAVVQTLCRHHHENMWPMHRQLIRDRKQIVVEGSALRTRFLQNDTLDPVVVVLVCTPQTLRQRIAQNAGHLANSAAVEGFITRTLAENAEFEQTSTGFGLRVALADTAAQLRDLEDELVNLMH